MIVCLAFVCVVVYVFMVLFYLLFLSFLIVNCCLFGEIKMNIIRSKITAQKCTFLAKTTGRRFAVEDRLVISAKEVMFYSAFVCLFVCLPVSLFGSTENAGPENERPMRDHLDQRATDTTGK